MLSQTKTACQARAGNVGIFHRRGAAGGEKSEQKQDVGV